MKNKKIKVLYLTAECKPFSKVGGVGDVAGELPPALHQQGVQIEIVTPLYGVINRRHIGRKTDNYEVIFAKNIEPVFIHQGKLKNVPVNFVKNPTYFEGDYAKPYIYSRDVPFKDDILRFSFFSEACLELIRRRQPDIVHINDWVLGYLFGLMKMARFPPKRVLTVHNIGYQGNIGIASIKDWEVNKILQDPHIGPFFLDPRPEWKSVNALRLALELSHKVNTVSPTYCKEMTKPENESAFFEGGKGLEKVAGRLYEKGKLIGILNGFEYKQKPTDQTFQQRLAQKAGVKKALASAFADQEAFLLGFVGRAVEQKFRLLLEKLEGRTVLEHILALPGVNVAILASGLPEYETFIRNIAKQGKINFSSIIAFDRVMAKNISLGSDVFLMPSLFEPCGITQMESLSNATPPLVRFTGGLTDTVKPHTADNGTGFGFTGASRTTVLRNLVKTVKIAAKMFYQDQDKFRSIQRNGFFERFDWTDTAKKYVKELYLPVLNSSKGE